MSDQSIASAIEQIILALHITPQTTLSATASAGAQTIQVADHSHFSPGGTLLFADALGEEMLTIADKSPIGQTPHTITLDFTGLDYSSLQHTHTSGATVYTNLQTDAPVEIAPMLAKGDPFIFVMGMSEQVQTKTVHWDGGTVTVHIQYHRSLYRPDDGQMAPNIWAKRQQTQARTDLAAIAHAIRTNRTLVVNGTQHAVDLGERGNPYRPLLTKSWQKLTVSNDTEQFIAALDVTVQDLWEPF